VGQALQFECWPQVRALRAGATFEEALAIVDNKQVEIQGGCADLNDALSG
jgi:hypothetical protein